MASRSQVFMAKVDRWVKEQPQKIEAFARQVCFEVAERAHGATPVDTGFLRGSWQPSIGKPSLDHKGKQDPAGASVSAAIAVVVQGLKVGERFYMVNNANYARHQEYGTSKMAGRFYVTDTAKQWQAICNQVAQELGLKK